MAESFAIQSLMKERKNLIDERDKMTERFNAKIEALEFGIETLSGKKVWIIDNEEFFDDTHPDYIRNTEDGI